MLCALATAVVWGLTHVRRVLAHGLTHDSRTQVAEATEVAQHADTLAVAARKWFADTKEGGDKLAHEVKRRMIQRRGRLQDADKRARSSVCVPRRTIAQRQRAVLRAQRVQSRAAYARSQKKYQDMEARYLAFAEGKPLTVHKLALHGHAWRPQHESVTREHRLTSAAHAEKSRADAQKE